MRRALVVLSLTAMLLYGCPPGFHEPRPQPAHKEVPPGQIRRQTTPSGPKPVPPGQMKRDVPAHPLPSVVVFGPDPYYFYEGFYYFLVGDTWYYSDDKNGPRVKLPKSHYPKEVRRKGKGKGKGKDK